MASKDRVEHEIFKCLSTTMVEVPANLLIEHLGIFQAIKEYHLLRKGTDFNQFNSQEKQEQKKTINEIMIDSPTNDILWVSGKYLNVKLKEKNFTSLYDCGAEVNLIHSK
ncbi:hypothetical protein HMI54_008656, partial [Coelomomyces lativittatus]